MEKINLFLVLIRSVTFNDNKIYFNTMKKIEYFDSIDRTNPNDINNLIYHFTRKIDNFETNLILQLVEHNAKKDNFIRIILKYIKRI